MPATVSAASAWGEVQDFRWQVETFGFHLASLEVRQHSAVLSAAIEALDEGAPERELVPGVTAGEVLATFRGMAAAQARMGERAVHRFVVSFTARRRGRPERPRPRRPCRPRPIRRPALTDGLRPRHARRSTWSRSSSRPSALERDGAILDALLSDPALPRASRRRAAIARR